MKKTIRVVVGILVVLAVLFGVLNLSLGKIVLKGVNATAPAALGVPVTLHDADIALLRGKIALSGLHVGNPDGYKTDGLLDLGSLSVVVDNSTLLSDVVVIKEITIDGLVVTYEKGLLNSNLGALVDLLSAGEGQKPEENGETQEEKAGKEKPGKKVVIEKLTISGSKMNFSITGAAALTRGGAIPIPLPPITLTDLGKEKEGVTPVEAVQNILKAILGAAGTAISGAGNLVGDGVGAVGEGAVDAGKAVVDGTMEAGQAIVDGASDALKAINPFKK